MERRRCPGSTGWRFGSCPTNGGVAPAAGVCSKSFKVWPRWNAPTPDLVLVRRTESQTVIKAAARLRQIDQEILRLTLWEQLSHADAAIVLGLEPGAVKQRAFRARRNLANEYLKLTKDTLPPAALKGGGS